MKVRFGIVACVAAIAIAGCSGDSPGKLETSTKSDELASTTTTAFVNPNTAKDAAGLRTEVRSFCSKLAPAWRAFSHSGDPGDGQQEALALAGLPLNWTQAYPSAPQVDQDAVKAFYAAATSFKDAALAIASLVANPPRDVTAQLATQNQKLKTYVTKINQITSTSFGIASCNGS